MRTAPLVRIRASSEHLLVSYRISCCGGHVALKIALLFGIEPQTLKIQRFDSVRPLHCSRARLHGSMAVALQHSRHCGAAFTQRSDAVKALYFERLRLDAKQQRDFQSNSRSS